MSQYRFGRQYPGADCSGADNVLHLAHGSGRRHRNVERRLVLHRILFAVEDLQRIPQFGS